MGWGSGGATLVSTTVSDLSTPTPTPSHKGEGLDLRAGVTDEFLRRPLAPLRPQRFFGGNEIGAIGEVEAIAVGPVLVDAAPGIGPIVIDLAAEHVAADAPHMLVLAGLL